MCSTCQTLTTKILFWVMKKKWKNKLYLWMHNTISLYQSTEIVCKTQALILQMFQMIFLQVTFSWLIEKKKMGGINIDFNLFEITPNHENANDIWFDYVSHRIFVYCCHFIEYIEEPYCQHYFSIMFHKHMSKIYMVKKTSVNTLWSAKCWKKYSDTCRFVLC